MRAKIWRDESGYWCWDVRAPGLRSTGGRDTWKAALEAAFDEMRWIGTHSGWRAA